MLILLPPSEGKATGQRGRAIDLDAMSFPALTDTRRKVIDALVDASGRDDALDVLGVSAGLADQVDANTRLWDAPTLKASDLYTGVLYDALGLGSVDSAAKRRANSRLVVVSALFGALRPSDRVPAYRLSMGIDLPGIGKLAGVWQGPLDEVLPTAAGRGLIVDMRSSTYVAAWRPSGPLAERTVAVHVVREENGTRSVVSHMAKHMRGVIARHLLETGVDPKTPEDLADVLADAHDVELDEPRSGRPRRLEVVERV